MKRLRDITLFLFIFVLPRNIYSAGPDNPFIINLSSNSSTSKPETATNKASEMVTFTAVVTEVSDIATSSSGVSEIKTTTKNFSAIVTMVVTSTPAPNCTNSQMGVFPLAPHSECYKDALHGEFFEDPRKVAAAATTGGVIIGFAIAVGWFVLAKRCHLRVCFLLPMAVRPEERQRERTDEN